MSTCVAADPNPFAWIMNEVGSATAAAWAVVAEKYIGAFWGAGNRQQEDGNASSGDGDDKDDVSDVDSVRGSKYLQPNGSAGVAVDEFQDMMSEGDEEDDDGVSERLAAREAGEDADSDGLEARIMSKRIQGGWVGNQREKMQLPKLQQREVKERRSGEQRVFGDPIPPTGNQSPGKTQLSVKKEWHGGFFTFGRRQKPSSAPSDPGRQAVNRAAKDAISYGGLEQHRVMALMSAGLLRPGNASLDTPIPYDLQRELFAQLQSPALKKRRRKEKRRPAPEPTSSGMKSHVSISRDVLRPVSQSEDQSVFGPPNSTTEVLGRIQRDIESLDPVLGSSRKKRKNGKEARHSKEKKATDNNAGWGGPFGFLFGRRSVSRDEKGGRDSDADAKEGQVNSSAVVAPSGPNGDAVVSSFSQTSVGAKRPEDASLQTKTLEAGKIGRQDASKDISNYQKNGKEPVAKDASFLNVPLELVGDLLNAVWWVRGQEERSAGKQEEDSKKTNVAAYAAAMTRDMSVTEETAISGAGAAAAAFAAASAIATSTQASELDAIEAAGLQASVSAARAIGTREDADVFVDTVGVGSLVVATRVLTGQPKSSALTALANIAILRHTSRVDMLREDGGSLILSLTQILHVSDRFNPVSQVVDREAALYKTELLVSGTHLLGSLALAGGLVGSEWRRRMATDTSLIASLKKLAGGVQKGEPEGAARAARRALGALGINDWVPRIPGQRGLRVLSIDGGGTRAIMAFEMLKHLEMLTGSRISEMFDVIGGTSTGAIVAASLGIAHKSVEDVESLYRRLIGKIFAKNAGPVQSAKLLLTKAFYDTRVLEDSLKRECGTGVFIDSLAEEEMNKVFVVSSIMSRSPQELHVFRNYTYPLGHESRYDGTSEAQLWEALRASSAAPTYFSEILVNGELHADGAIVANNPTAVALHETKCMYPGVPIECVVSMGNGLSAADIAAAGRRNGTVGEAGDDKGKSVGWGDVVGSIVASATNTEGVHNALDDLFPKSKYFRFNPVTSSNEIDATSPEKLADFVRDARVYIQQNPDRFAEVARLLRPKTNRSLWRRFRDALSEELSALSAIEDDVYLL